MTLLGAILGALLAGLLNERHGRKPTILLGSILFTLGGFLMMFAWDKRALITGRVVVGLGVGVCSQATPVYLAELVPPDRRGGIVTYFQFAITVGILVAASVDWALISTRNWRLMFGLSVIPSITQAFLMVQMPESPRWLVAHGLKEEGRQVLEKVNADIIHSDNSSSNPAYSDRVTVTRIRVRR